ncbi:hypothetical protein IV37_GL000188 [Fructilactobacillus fructivorans]|uniref:hypothetical protein n=1 Tax=Fructilactobacillus fructivorans TaxID=1614 RepID=UPI0007049A8D|nr:hypothetical protein [Fructilactobacillus fructivorans]KRN13466.1 hypothetical protein IV37_GL000188 [Fructilactobacillus fructivorans]
MTTSKKTNNAKLTALFDAQIKKRVTFKDEKGNDKTESITLERPSTSTTMQVMDALQQNDNFSDLAKAFFLVMRDVIVSPKMSYPSLDEDLPKTKQEKEITLKNKDGKEFKFLLKFPGYEKTFVILSQTSNNRGGMNLANTLPVLLDEVVRTSDRHYVQETDFDPGEKYDGLIFQIYQEAMNYLADLTNYNGLMEKLNKATTFLTESIQFSNN